MTRTDCEIACMAAMAMEEGYVSELPAAQIEAHLAECSDCRREVGQLRALTNLLDGQKRRERTENIWDRVEQHLPNALPIRTESRVGYAFLILGLLMLGYRLVELIPDRHFGVLFKLVPILFVIAAFIYLRENPFKINSELTLEGRITK